MSRLLSHLAVAEYHERGFHLARGLFDRDEIEL
ncbi:MAG: phytanoyl-CoA dioxygenase family protein, partial [Gemmataceae bacterium]|nr:phytanoyl-CoA dioxygenase family protein [Gemmataceae bacterium]